MMVPHKFLRLFYFREMEENLENQATTAPGHQDTVIDDPQVMQGIKKPPDKGDGGEKIGAPVDTAALKKSLEKLNKIPAFTIGSSSTESSEPIDCSVTSFDTPPARGRGFVPNKTPRLGSLSPTKRHNSSMYSDGSLFYEARLSEVCNKVLQVEQQYKELLDDHTSLTEKHVSLEEEHAALKEELKTAMDLINALKQQNADQTLTFNNKMTAITGDIKLLKAKDFALHESQNMAAGRANHHDSQINDLNTASDAINKKQKTLNKAVRLVQKTQQQQTVNFQHLMEEDTLNPVAKRQPADSGRPFLILKPNEDLSPREIEAKINYGYTKPILLAVITTAKKNKKLIFGQAPSEEVRQRVGSLGTILDHSSWTKAVIHGIPMNMTVPEVEDRLRNYNNVELISAPRVLHCSGPANPDKRAYSVVIALKDSEELHTLIRRRFLCLDRTLPVVRYNPNQKPKDRTQAQSSAQAPPSVPDHNDL